MKRRSMTGAARGLVTADWSDSDVEQLRSWQVKLQRLQHAPPLLCAAQP